MDSKLYTEDKVQNKIKGESVDFLVTVNESLTSFLYRELEGFLYSNIPKICIPSFVFLLF